MTFRSLVASTGRTSEPATIKLFTAAASATTVIVATARARSINTTFGKATEVLVTSAEYGRRPIVFTGNTCVWIAAIRTVGIRMARVAKPSFLNRGFTSLHNLLPRPPRLSVETGQCLSTLITLRTDIPILSASTHTIAASSEPFLTLESVLARFSFSLPSTYTTTAGVYDAVARGAHGALTGALPA